MIRVVKLNSGYYGYDMGDILEMDMEEFYNTHVDGFVNSGDPVLLLNDLEDVEYFIEGIDKNDIQMIEKGD